MNDADLRILRFADPHIMRICESKIRRFVYYADLWILRSADSHNCGSADLKNRRSANLRILGSAGPQNYANLRILRFVDPHIHANLRILRSADLQNWITCESKIRKILRIWESKIRSYCESPNNTSIKLLEAWGFTPPPPSWISNCCLLPQLLSADS